MKSSQSRRSFFKKSVAVTVAAPLVTSLEEFALTAQEAPRTASAASVPKATLPTGTIGKVKISRLICGGNLISGYAHSRDLIYVSKLLKSYFTEEKITETWALSEAHGVNTMIFNPSDRRALAIYRKYRLQGGKIQCLAQLDPAKSRIEPVIKEAVDAGVVGVVLVGNLGDAWTREGDLDSIGKFIAVAKGQGIIAGVGGHELRTPMAVEKAGLKPDFYMKTLHGTNYWWARETEVRDVPVPRSTHSEDLILPISSKMTDTHVEVLTTEVDPTSLATQYVNNEVPTAIALTHRFEEWLRGSLLKLTLHVLNRNRQEKPSGALIYQPKLPDNSPISSLCTPLSAPQTLMLSLCSDDPVPGDGTGSLICAFCKREGERQVSGRLLPSEEGLWVHVNCAYWSMDIEWLQECGGLLNFPQALTRSKKSKCSECGKLGATLI